MSDEGKDPIRITVEPLGTIIVHGEVRVEDREGNGIPLPVAKNPGMVKFCGCGRSKTKPFCDGSHKCSE
jgi:CDGSH-type Zn-finger protein